MLAHVLIDLSGSYEFLLLLLLSVVRTRSQLALDGCWNTETKEECAYMKTVLPSKVGWFPSMRDATQLFIHLAPYQHPDVKGVSRLAFIDTQTFRIRILAASDCSRDAWLEALFDNFV